MSYAQQAQAIIDRQGSRAEQHLLDLPVSTYQQHQTANPGARPTATYHVSLDYRAEAFHKPFAHVDVPLTNTYGHHHREPPIHECAAWRLAHAIGAPLNEIVTPVVMRECQGKWGSLAAGCAGVPGTDASIRVRPDQSLATAFFDSLIGQQDRHLLNIHWDASVPSLHLFDHGYAFAIPGNYFNYSFFVQWRWATGQQALETWEHDALDAMLGSSDHFGMDVFLRPDRAQRLGERAEMMLAAGTILGLGQF